MYEVKNTFTKQVNTVDAATCCCTCYIGSTGAPCKSQFLISKEFQIPVQFLASYDTAAKFKYHKIAYGSTTDLPPEWHNCLNLEESILILETAPIASCSTVASSLNATCSSENVHNELPEQFDLENQINKLQVVFQDLHNRLTKNPSTYAEAIAKFVDSYEKCSLDSDSILNFFAN